nr:PREDICTED: uncharacterized protein LOC109035672 [Bemisia tabaci]
MPTVNFFFSLFILGYLISTITALVPIPDHHIFAEVWQQNRRILKDNSLNDRCRDKPIDEDDVRCPWLLPFNYRIAGEQCKDMWEKFKNLSQREVDYACPSPREPKCRRCGKVRFGCTFMCKPRDVEIRADQYHSRPIRRVRKCRHASDIVTLLNL